MSDAQLATVPMLAPSTMEQAMIFAQQMADANLLPAHLKKSPPDCLRVVLQAARWQMDPFAVADKTSIISGKMMYEGQLVSAVVNARGKLAKRLNYSFKGEGDARELTVSGTLHGEDEPRTIELPFSLAKKINKNGQMGINPDQQATYIGARLWARRHTPELMLGVYTPDEVDPDGAEPVNVTPGAEAEVQKRPPPPERSATGAAAVAENAAAKKRGGKKEEKAIDVSATPAAEGNSAPPDSGASPKSEPPAAGNPAPAAEPRTSLNAGETATFVVNVESFTTSVVNNKPTVKAQVKGQFDGPVYHMDGAVTEGDKLTAKSPAWQIERPVKLTILGQPGKNAGVVFAMVQSIEFAEPVKGEVLE